MASCPGSLLDFGCPDSHQDTEVCYHTLGGMTLNKVVEVVEGFVQVLDIDHSRMPHLKIDDICKLNDCHHNIL